MVSKKGKKSLLSILITINGVLHYLTQANTALAFKVDVSQFCTPTSIPLYDYVAPVAQKDHGCNKYQHEIIIPKKNRVNRQPYSSSRKIFRRKKFSDKQTIVQKPSILDRPLERAEQFKSKYQTITALVVDVNPQLTLITDKDKNHTTSQKIENCINTDRKYPDIKKQVREIKSINTSDFCANRMNQTILSGFKTQKKIQSIVNGSPNLYLLSQTSESQSPPQSPIESPVQREQKSTQPEENSQPIDPPPVEGEPANINNNNPSPTEIEKNLNTTEFEATKKNQRLRQLLQENKKPVLNPPSERDTQPGVNTGIDSELGKIRVVERPLEQLPIPQKSVAKFKPIGSLRARFGYFQTSNIFSARINPEIDGLFYSGLTLSSIPLRLGGQTYLRGSIDGNIFRYVNQSDFNYNQLGFNLGIFQRLNSKMYAELGWRNQQLFYAGDSERFNIESGDKFLNENAFRLSVGRRDPLSKKLMLDSFYELRLSLTDIPDKRDRIINYLSLFLNYYLQKPLQVGFGYQFNYSDFTERTREDQYHRLRANLNYKMSDYSNVSLQTGILFGSSTQDNIDFDGWFFSINYNLDLGKF